MLPKSSLIALSLVAAATLVSAQSTADDTSKQLDPSATCPWQAGDQIVQCLATVESDEATRSGGPCTTNDWECICNVSGVSGRGGRFCGVVMWPALGFRLQC